MQVAQEPSDSSQNRRSYICPKCSSVFDKFDIFNDHIKGLCVMESVQKPYCIIYNSSNEASSNKKKLNLSVDDYFYGHVEGSRKYKKKVIHRKFSCYSCGKLLRNNLRFMSHVRHKIENEWKENDSVNDFNICNHCHRRYTSPFHLQCHIETVHTPAPAATTCRICELNFNNEELFLCHMKDLHSYNEMPYVCKVCSYRSSFYHDVIQHFKLNHENCSSLQCSFCLAIHHTANSFLTHVIQHMNKYLRCCKCRLQFFNSKDKSQHLKTDHLSVLSVPGKKILPKNPNDFTIFVKVSHHPLSPSKNRPLSKSSFGANKDSPAALNLSLEHGWMLDSQEDEDIPLGFQPFVRNSNISVRLSYKAVNLNSNKCTECGDILGLFPAKYNCHFQKEHRCSKCSFHTYCPNAMKKHVLKTHLKYVQQGGMSEYSSMGKLDGFNGETAYVLQNKASSSRPEYASPMEKENFLQRSFKNSEQRMESVLTNPLTFQSWSPRRKRSRSPNLSTGQSTAFDDKSWSGLSANPKSMHFKRPKTDSIHFVEKSVHENQQQCENESSSKPRRKQLKPQKVVSTDEGSPSPVLKPLSKIVDEAANDWIGSGSPPDLFADILGDSDENENRETTRKSNRKRKPTIKMNFKSNRGQESPTPVGAPMLSATFASQLGLGKKKKKGDQAKRSPQRKSRSYAAKSQHLSALTAQSESSIAIPSSHIKWIQQPQTNIPSNQPAQHTQFTIQPTTITDSMFGGKELCRALVRKPSNIDQLRPPSNITFSEVTKSSFLVSWIPPANCSVTQYKLIFQGSGLPTTQALPPAQTSVRLIGLRSSTSYIVRLCSVYKDHCSRFADSVQRTLALREKKNASPVKADNVIVLDDDDDDVILVADASSQPAVCSDSVATSCDVNEEMTNSVSGLSEEGNESASAKKPQLAPIKPLSHPKCVTPSRLPAIIIPNPGPHKKLFLVNKTKVSSMKMADITSLKLTKPCADKPKADSSVSVKSTEENNKKSPKPIETKENGPVPESNGTASLVDESQPSEREVNPSVLIRNVDDTSEKRSDETNIVEAGTSDDEELLQDTYVLVAVKNTPSDSEQKGDGTKCADFGKEAQESAMDTKETESSIDAAHVAESDSKEFGKVEEPEEKNMVANAPNTTQDLVADSPTTNEERKLSLASLKDDSIKNSSMETEETDTASATHNTDANETDKTYQNMNGTEADEIDSNELSADANDSITEDLPVPSILEDSTKVSVEKNNSEMNGIQTEDTKTLADTNKSYDHPLTTEDLDRLWNLLNE